MVGDKEIIESIDFVLNGVASLRNKLNRNKPEMKVLDKELSEFQKSLNKKYWSRRMNLKS